YLATVKGVPHGSALERLQQGIELEDGMTAPAEVEYQDADPDNGRATIRITIYEGRNRQIRRMFEAIGHPVLLLKRIKFGELTLQGQPRGKYPHQQPQDVQELLAEAGKTHKIHKK